MRIRTQIEKVSNRRSVPLSSPLPVILRDASPEDVGFVFKPWLQELRQLPSTRWISDRVFFQRHGALIARLLQWSHVTLACNPRNLEHLYGFVCFAREPTPGCLHWLYTKDTYRRMGVGVELLAHVRMTLKLPPESPLTLTHPSAILLGVPGLREKLRLVYDPYLLSGGP